MLKILKTIFIFLLITGNSASFASTFSDKLVKAAIERTHHAILYDGAYISISYPDGDIPANKGVCTDVIIRTYRKVGIDLQQKVHEDMKANFRHYPSFRIWGLKQTDKNIDHRRVPNLRVFLRRFGLTLNTDNNPESYKPGDIVTWMLPGNLPHIGIVINRKSTDGKRPLVVHNIGEGPKINDMLFNYKITGHYRYHGQ